MGLGFANANSVPTTSMDLPTKRCMPRIRNTKMRRTPFHLVNKKLERLCNKPEIACVRKVRFQNPVESDTSDTVAGSDSDSDWEGMSVDAGMEGKKETALPRGENLDMGRELAICFWIRVTRFRVGCRDYCTVVHS